MALVVSERQNELVIDSRLIADELGINHKNFLETLRNYLTEIEQDFGSIPFETLSLETPGGLQQITLAYLNEDQATYVMTLSRNTEQVRLAKRNLVKAFSQAKKRLAGNATLNSDLLQALNERLEKFESDIETGRSHNLYLKQQQKENPGLITLMEGAGRSMRLPAIKVWYTASEWASSKEYSLDSRQRSVLSAQSAAVYKNFKGRNPNVGDAGAYIYSTHEEYILSHAMNIAFNVTTGLEEEIQGLSPVSLTELCAMTGVYLDPKNQLSKSLIHSLINTAIRNEELPHHCKYSSNAYYPLGILKDYLYLNCNRKLPNY